MRYLSKFNIPDTIAEFGIEVADGIDLYSDPVFMMLKLF